MEKEGLKFQTLEVEHFKNIDKKIVNIDGRSLLITGANGTGKSSFIQALLSGIDQKIQAVSPIKNGENKGSVKVAIAGVLNGIQEEYQLEMYYTQGNQKGRLVLLNSKGEAVKSPKAVLESIIGNISFDIFKFLNAKKVDQIKVLKELSGVSKDIDIIDIQRKKIYDERTFMNRKVDEAEAVMNNHGFTQEEIDAYSSPIDISKIQEEMNGISTKISQYNDIKNKMSQFNAQAERITLESLSIEEKIEQLKAQIKDAEEALVANAEMLVKVQANIEKGNLWLKNNVEPSASDVSKRLNEATSHNEKHQLLLSFINKQKSLVEDKKKAQEMTEDIKKLDEKKDALIKKGKLPIKGLSFSADDIFLNGLPFEENQINTATLIEVGAEISMALNPHLKVLFIHEGSLFDKKALEALIQKCESRGYQIIAEIVSEEADATIHFTEEFIGK